MRAIQFSARARPRKLYRPYRASNRRYGRSSTQSSQRCTPTTQRWFSCGSVRRLRKKGTPSRTTARPRPRSGRALSTTRTRRCTSCSTTCGSSRCPRGTRSSRSTRRSTFCGCLRTRRRRPRPRSSRRSCQTPTSRAISRPRPDRAHRRGSRRFHRRRQLPDLHPVKDHRHLQDLHPRLRRVEDRRQLDLHLRLHPVKDHRQLEDLHPRLRQVEDHRQLQGRRPRLPQVEDRRLDLRQARNRRRRRRRPRPE